MLEMDLRCSPLWLCTESCCHFPWCLASDSAKPVSAQRIASHSHLFLILQFLSLLSLSPLSLSFSLSLFHFVFFLGILDEESSRALLRVVEGKTCRQTEVFDPKQADGVDLELEVSGVW